MKTRLTLESSIDGVLLRKSTPIAGAPETLKYLQKHEIPFVFLTNGGGKTEAERAAQLSTLLGIDLDPAALVQSHTPFKQLVHERSNGVLGLGRAPQNLREKTVLVMGSDASKARAIAHEYGFESVVTPADILEACPEIFPFDPSPEFYKKQQVLPLPKPLWTPGDKRAELKNRLKIDAVLIFNDPRDWAVDIQLIADLAGSYEGYLGTRAKDFLGLVGHDYAPVPVVFSNPDMLWSAGYHLPRFGQGAFRAAVYAALSGSRQSDRVENMHYFGKPHSPAYFAAEAALHSQFQQLLQSGQHDNILQPTHLDRVYMVGDNPASDIRGAHTHNYKCNRWADAAKRQMYAKKADRTIEIPGPYWVPCLVRTGVYRYGDSFVSRNREPEKIFDDVKSAVDWALTERHGWAKDWLQESHETAEATAAA